MSKYKVVQFIDGKVKYNEIYDGYRYDEIVKYCDDLVGEAFDSYEIVEIVG